MINDLINLNNIYEILLLAIIFYYIVFRIVGKREQKKLDLNNFEYWVYYNLGDLYKYNGYGDPTQKAIETINNIKDKIRKGI